MLEANPPNTQFIPALARQDQGVLLKYCKQASDLKKEEVVSEVLDKLYEVGNATGMMNLVSDSGLGFEQCPVALVAKVQRHLVGLAKRNCFGNSTQTEALLKYPTHSVHYSALLREYLQERKEHRLDFKTPEVKCSKNKR